MIRTDSEYAYAVDRVKQEMQLIAAERDRLKAEGLTRQEMKRLLDPMITFRLQFMEEIAAYEGLKRGEFGELRNFQGIGPLLIGLRIYRGVSQRELAEKLGVHESQVSRDERHEYAGVTLERAEKILEALGVQLKTRVNMPASREARTPRRNASRWRRGARRTQHVAK
jgi:DNA-binding Xre family transcriptional regulator